MNNKQKNPIVLWFESAIKDVELLDEFSKREQEGVLINFMYAKSAYEDLISYIQNKLTDIMEEF